MLISCLREQCAIQVAHLCFRRISLTHILSWKAPTFWPPTSLQDSYSNPNFCNCSVLLRTIATIIIVVIAEKKSSSRNLESERNDLKVKNGRQFHTNCVDTVMDVSEI